ncbi:hypothetical protein TrVE_jg7617 [Triparma verrucosa]|uniref:Fe2OG dioxygenase domain-containing protein n=1 Tax=Triparma verrucosa TaxID=1606542 RepID=A0A9W7C1T3_9STRA|nr:hypothetical protein TrVE_jg7617 [Triparma verrucosa]
MSALAARMIDDDAVLIAKGVVRHQVFDTSEYSKDAASSNPASPGLITSFLPSLGLLSIKEVSPFNQSLEDNEYAYYKNLLEDKDTPEMKKFITQVLSSCTPLLLEHFVNSIDEIKLDDVFCISYNSSQHDSRCAKHQDPSDITVNICLERTEDLGGSQIMFYGAKQLKSSTSSSTPSTPTEEEVFLVDTRLGCCTIHYGAHPHETSVLTSGERTNIVLTFVYADQNKSGADRTCYAY